MRKSLHLFQSLVAFGAVSLTLSAQLPNPDGGGLERGSLPARWLSQQSKCIEIPKWQVHEYSRNFLILRQSPCTDFEKPFVFLFFGKDKAILWDTGSTDGDIVPALSETIHRWLEHNGHTSIPLVVTHTHSHEDHTWGDKAIQAMSDPAIPITFVAPTIAASKKFFHIEHWPDQVVSYDLGDRILDIIPIPGHTDVDLAVYDRKTGVLLTGDTLYPGRLYVDDFEAYQASVDRLVEFTQGKLISHTLGDHIEQTTTPFLDYPVGTLYQPEEHELALPVGSLLELQQVVRSMHGQPRRLATRDFTVWAGPDPNSAQEDAEFKRHREEEKRKMWEEKE